ncbi:hypothetical protein LCGC14_2428070 [marine sediment metagenome]|uniref:Tc1-like transposase DDE domain-containing protein n=1 Tax=marine sediment metagenome TaxID=412755 RepID=A0A0F9DZP1_9ZZZZ
MIKDGLEQIAHVLLLTDEAIRRHVLEYRSIKKLETENGGSESKLSEEQAKLLESHLEKHVYLYIKDIVYYVKATFGINYSVSGLRYWLQGHDFSYKKPSIVPGKANIQNQIEWIAQYQKLKSELSENETICFIDGVHPTHNIIAACGWIKRGERKEIAANSGRSRLNLSGAIDILSKKLVVQEDQTLNSTSTISFFQKIEVAYPNMHKIPVFCDNARYYRNKNVQAYLKPSKIDLHYLPSYSPNLNPIERLWKWLKERVLYNTYYQEFEDFRNAVMGFLENVSNLNPTSSLGEELATRVRDKFRPITSPVSNS